MNKYLKYKKKKNCRYPFISDTLGYCWGYAAAKDKKWTDKTIEKLVCKDCEYYKKEEK